MSAPLLDGFYSKAASSVEANCSLCSHGFIMCLVCSALCWWWFVGGFFPSFYAGVLQFVALQLF